VEAGRDRPAVLSDATDGRALLAPERLAEQRRRAGARRAGGGPTPRPGDTTYLCAVDADRMAVSLIQSNASGFGSHLFEPATGINLHNRGIGFSLEPRHLAELAPGRRPPHTLSPLLVTRTDGSLRAVLGTQGGDGQPQILLQLLARLLGAGQGPGPAVASPRWVLQGAGTGFDTWTAAGGPTASIEAGAPSGWARAIREVGLEATEGPAFDHRYGHAQVIETDDGGGLSGAADPRARIGSAAGI
jgi:gamma-glutamyltranspeptidase/glutathione hydrolase